MTRLLLLFAVSLSLASCTTYSPPPGSTAQNAATLMGSRIHNPGMAVDTRAQPQDVDGHSIFSNGFSGDKTLLLPPGTHTVIINVARYGFPVVSGSSDPVKVTLEAGKTYMIRATNPVPSTGSDGQVSGWANASMAWIETSGTPVTEKRTVILNAPPAPEIPIFMPVR